MNFLWNRWNLRAAIALSALSFTSCATMQPADFAGSTTHFELDRYFTGHTRSFGVFENRSGQPRRTFTADSFGQRDAEGGVTLTQHFKFNDGMKQQRVWHIRRVDVTHWDATANDVVGIAHATSMGNALYWEYAINVNPKNPLATVHVRQWIYQAEGTDTVMTRLVITKLGITLFEVVESIHHVSP